jgi:DNA polymerase III alpha subunit (gram-positive type)
MLDADTYSLQGFVFSPRAGQRYVIFDVEATGADPAADSVSQLGAVAVYESGPRDVETFACLVKPWKAIPEKIERLTGITNTSVAAAGDFASVWTAFASFCGDSPLVTQCGYEFDFVLLDAECDRVGLPRLSGERLDTKALFKMLHTESDETFSTDFLVKYYGVDPRPFRRHDALGDAQLISRIFHAQLQEMKSRGIRRMETCEPVSIRRFKLPTI